MPERLYSIVIPTRDRPDTLCHTVKTVMNLTRSNYELIIMDNCGAPEVRQAVDAFASPQICYFRSSERLSMADNWERGLAEARGDYVTIIGDDDGIMPDALDLAMRFHRDRPDDILSWWPFVWLWPDADAAGLRNLAQMHFGAHVQRRDSRAFLKMVLACEADWTTLPTLYCSFVPRRNIDEMRVRHGRYFLAPLADVFSGIANLLASEEFFYSYRPLTCWGISRHSTGGAQFFDRTGAVEQFDAENANSALQAPWDERLRGAELIVEIRVADLYLKMKDLLFPDDDSLKIDLAAFIRHVATRSAPRLRHRWDEVRRAVEDMAAINGLDPADFPVAPPDEAAPDRFGYHPVHGQEDVVRYYHCTDPECIRTIGDFIDYACRLCLPSDRVRMPGTGPAPAAARLGPLPMRFREQIRRILGTQLVRKMRGT